MTEAGSALLAEKPSRIGNDTLTRYPAFADWVRGTRETSQAAPEHQTSGIAPAAATPALQDTSTPRERIDAAQRELEAALRVDLLDRIRRMIPADFEDLIVRVLLAMGYGRGLDELGRALGGSGDGGVDGVIYQDPLGLDRVYVQAKRYKEGNGVSSPDIRNFIGALHLQRASKGVFVTASHFTAEAKGAASGATFQMVLIDGETLADLMIRYNVGVLVRGVVEIKALDEGFFAE